jgi:hypoxanthine-guanine phosphoribosyltransferase
MDKSNRTGGSNGDVMGIEPSFIMGFGMGYSVIKRGLLEIYHLVRCVKGRAAPF